MSDREQKNEKRETLAGIVAEMRNLGKLDEKSTDKIPRRLMGLGLRTYAGRIEAALKREKAEVEADALSAGGIVEAARKREREPVTERHAIGNAAAMREALVGIRYLIADEPDGTPMIDAMKAMTDAALAVPARNCDLPLVVDGHANNNADKAWLVFKRHNPDAYFDVSGLLRCIDWLLAPAAERKGEGDGR